MKEEISAVVVHLDIAGENALFVLLALDGTINRMGTGAVDNTERDMFMGISQDHLFEKFMAGVDESLFKNAGHYTFPDPQGLLCTLTLSFQVPPDAKGRDRIGFEFVYGADSQGPPEPIKQMVITAVRLTDPWYEQQKQMIRDNIPY